MDSSSDVIDDSFNETEINNSLNNISVNSMDKQVSTGNSSVDDVEVDDSLLSNKSLSEETVQKTPEKTDSLLNDSDNINCVSTKKNRRRIVSDSEDEVEDENENENENEIEASSSFSQNNTTINKSINETYREVLSNSGDSENSEDSENSDEEEIPVISDDEDSSQIQQINLNDIKSKLSATLKQPTLQTMVANLTMMEQKPLQLHQQQQQQQQQQQKQEDKYYCTAAEYSNQATKVANLRTDALKCKNALRTVNLDSLPDKGALLRTRQFNLEKQLEAEEQKLKKMILDSKPPQEEKKISWDQLVANSNCVVPKTFGKQAMNTYSTQKTLTMERLKSLHDSLATCPDEKTLAEDPKGLKVELMPHQKRALAWLVWREGQKPPGGILADDMGLGKTLTMISLIVQTKELEAGDFTDSENENENPNDDKWMSRKSKIRPQGGTLVICPATLIGQWEGEIERRVKRNLLNVELYHGNKRETKATRLAKYDVVITTYKLVQGEYEKRGTLFNIKWKRIILDEAHVVRNHKAQTSIAVCGLTSKTRWALTGTPVHNKELDLFALLKFLRCSPFDDLVVWKQWVANKSAGGQDRLNTVMTSILLRRTKAQLQSEGALQSLPEKKFEEIYVELDDDEKKVYQKVLLFSRSLFIEFLRQREAKNPDAIYMRGAAPDATAHADDEQYNKMHRKMLDMYGGANIKSHQILVLLLRLRQICCHPSLIHAILDDENCATEGIEENGVDIDIFDKFANLNLDEVGPETTATDAENTAEDFNSAANKVLSSQNPVFQRERSNEKLRIITKIIEEKVIPNDDKIIIVSQWTTMLQIIYKHLKQSKIKCELLDGSVPVAKRNDLVNCFNDARQPVKVLLLSLTAGGVGLNLVGANHLLLVDLHWNPQLESQAQDRIYRVGQKKTVFVYKIITKETIEQRIKALQDRKLTMASDMLAGTRAAGASKLSLDDLKMLFNIGPQPPTNV